MQSGRYSSAFCKYHGYYSVIYNYAEILVGNESIRSRSHWVYYKQIGPKKSRPAGHWIELIK